MNRDNITRNMLSTIRDNMRKINENKNHDISKNFLFEQEEQQTTSTVRPEDDDVTNINDVDVRVISDGGLENTVTDQTRTEITSLIDSFREEVSQIAELTPGFTIKNEQIRLDGVLNDYNIKFVIISGEESGVYITSEMSKMDEDVVLFITKLTRFEQTYKDVVEPMIRDREGN